MRPTLVVVEDTSSKTLLLALKFCFVFISNHIQVEDTDSLCEYIHIHGTITTGMTSYSLSFLYQSVVHSILIPVDWYGSKSPSFAHGLLWVFMALAETVYKQIRACLAGSSSVGVSR